MFIIRLWHYKILPVLPDKMLIAEWRECIAIKRQWEKRTLKHRLVSYVMDYDKTYFLNYIFLVSMDMSKRNIKFNELYLKEIVKFCLKSEEDILESNFRVYKEHNDRYLKQCLYNLQEKADRGIINQEEWQKIEDKFGGEM